MTEVKPVQFAKAFLSMSITLSGMVIDVNPVHSSNAKYPILSTLPSVGITLFLHPRMSSLLSVSIRQLPSL